jgi:hypothetical protein
MVSASSSASGNECLPISSLTLRKRQVKRVREGPVAALNHVL